MIDIGKLGRKDVTQAARNKDTYYPFGVSGEALAEELRKFADAIDNKKVLIQRVQTGQVVGHDDYHMEALLIEFVQNRNDLRVALAGEYGLPVEITTEHK